MDIYVSDETLFPVKEKVLSGERLDIKDGITLYQSNDIIGIGSLANHVRSRWHGKKAFFVYNQHINYTNVCTNECRFCAFSREKGTPGAFAYSMQRIREMLTQRLDEPIRELHVVGGLHPDLGFDYFLDLVKTIKSIRPQATIKAFTAVEIDYLSKISGLEVDEVLTQLIAAGVEMMPGGGLEIMSERVREQLFPKKIGTARWLEVTEKAHRAGLKTNATMLYGHIETVPERVAHFIALRELQDKTQGFTAFIPLAFHSENTRLSEIPSTTAFDDLKNIAVARLMLDNFPHIKAYWVMISEKLAQVALSFGADDLDGTIIEEKITHMAGARSATGLSREMMIELIRSAGCIPVERDSFYNEVK